MKYSKIKKQGNKIVLYFPTLDFSFLRQRPQQIMSQFAKNGYSVLFCNNTQVKGKTMDEVEDNLYVVHDFEDLMIDIKHNKIKIDIAYATWAKSHEHFERAKAKLYIYDSLDNFKDWHQYESHALRKSDIVLTSSQELYNMRSGTKADVRLVRNACPSDYIDRSSTKPEEFKNLNHPIICMLGAWGTWCSSSLLKKVADKYKVFFIGMEFGNKLPSNVENLGVKDHEVLYDYYAHSDVCLIPFNLKNPITTSANPIKMYEQIAAGTLTVSTGWTETELYPTVVYTGRTEDQFIRALDRAVHDSVRKKAKIKATCREIALENTWEKRFEQIQEAIQQYNDKHWVM